MSRSFETFVSDVNEQMKDIKSRMPSFFDSIKLTESKDNNLNEKIENPDVSDVQEDASISEGKDQEKESGSMLDVLFRDEDKDENKEDDSEETNKKDGGQVIHVTDEVDEDDNPEDKTKKFLERLSEILSSSEEIKKIIEQNPELKAKIEKCLEILNNPEKHTPAEINWALDRIKKEIKGAIFEAAVKEALKSIGLDVEDSQRTVEGETGATRPDVIARNNTDKPIILFGKVINPGQDVYVECKCGRKEYMEGQLKNHLPNQLSGHDGVSILITTSDMDEVDSELLEEVSSKNDTTVVIMDSSAQDIEDVIKEAE